ncbi:hypothetical protein C2E23DRAFT_558238 [Lenzites betulinus]|nr:hypothetical protein C2E23DRAFT_558238 [Lenzites betulinus]
MHRKTLIVTPEKFMERFVPHLPDHMSKRDESTSSILNAIPVGSGRERKMYPPLVKALNDANICPGFQFVDTSSRGDGSERSNEAPDIGLYPSDRVPKHTTDPDGTEHSPPTDWSAVEFCIECKTNSDAHDPFEEKKGASKGIDPTTKERKEIFAQILAYAEFMFNRQQRMWIFMVLILGDHCRIIRFDRAGAVATQKFNYKTNGATLIEYLWRYAKWAESTRGHDPMAERILPGTLLAEQMKARAQKDKDTTKREDYVRRMFEESLDPRWYWWKLCVKPDGKEGEDRFFVVGKQNFQAPGVVGRGTRGYVALPADNIADGKFCYLKDTWRVVGPDIDKEGTILEHLNKHEVNYIPTLECHGDVGDQVTQTDALWDELNRRNEIEEGKVGEDIVSPLKKHRHYRIAVKEVGQPMSDFTSSRQLAHALWCCITAHSEAYKIGVIHRNISAGNLLLYYDAKTDEQCGLLNDWELSKRTDNVHLHARQLDRIGTWQFMSAMTLMTPGDPVTVEDELESFFNVLLYFSVRFLPHNCEKVADFMHAYFDDYSTLGNNYKCGFYKKACMETGHLDLDITSRLKEGPKATTPVAKVRECLEFSWMTPTGALAPGVAHPLDMIITTILQWIKGRYSLVERKRKASPAHAAESTANLLINNEEFDLPGYDPTALPKVIPLYSQDTISERARAEACAANLRTHSAIHDLLALAILNEDWPVADKMPDQLPKNGYQHSADLAIEFTNLSNVSGTLLHGANPPSTASSRKRLAAEVDELEVAGPSKRSK